MADRISALEASNAALEARASKVPKVKASKSGALLTTDDPAIAQLRLDLAESLRSKGVTEGRLRAAEEELGKLRTKTKDDARSVKALSTERALLTTRLKDREHELREKRKLLEVRVTWVACAVAWRTVLFAHVFAFCKLHGEWPGSLINQVLRGGGGDIPNWICTLTRSRTCKMK